MPKDTDDDRDQGLRVSPYLPTISLGVEQEKSRQLIGKKTQQSRCFSPSWASSNLKKLNRAKRGRRKEGFAFSFTALLYHRPCFSVLCPRFLLSASMELGSSNSVWITSAAVLVSIIQNVYHRLFSFYRHGSQHDVSEYQVYHGLSRDGKMQGST